MEERKGLLERLQRLVGYIGGGGETSGARFKDLDVLEQDRLKRQASVMRLYVGILSERIGAWE